MSFREKIIRRRNGEAKEITAPLTAGMQITKSPTGYSLPLESASAPVAQQLDGVEYGVEVVTPKDANRYLRHNVRNRRIKPAVVADYAREMAGGLWCFTAEPLIFDTDGVLLNGQHRLSGLVKAQVELPFLVVRGVAKEAFPYIDIGSRRNGKDVLSIHDPTAPGHAQQVLNKICSIRTASGRMGGSLSVPDIIQVYEAEKKQLKASGGFITKLDRQPRALANVNECIAFHMEFAHRHGANLANDFFTKILTGVGIQENTWEKVGRDRLMRSVGKKSGHQDFMNDLRKRVVIVTVWNKIRSGSPVGQLKIHAGVPDIL
jgi:hypothetical protein